MKPQLAALLHVHRTCPLPSFIVVIAGMALNDSVPWMIERSLLYTCPGGQARFCSRMQLGIGSAPRRWQSTAQWPAFTHAQPQGTQVATHEVAKESQVANHQVFYNQTGGPNDAAAWHTWARCVRCA